MSPTIKNLDNHVSQLKMAQCTDHDYIQLLMKICTNLKKE